MISMLKKIHNYWQIFENFWNKCKEMYKLHPAYFLSASGLARQLYLKNTEVEFELLIDVNMLLMVERDIRGGMCHAIHYICKSQQQIHERL